MMENNLMNWYYGKGKEGIKQARTGNCSTFKAVLVDFAFPWWYQTAHAEYITIYSIWLTKPSECLFDVIKECIRDVPVVGGAEVPERVRQDWQHVDFILIGGRVPDALASSDLWLQHGPRVVLATQTSRWQPPRPWYTQTVKLKHDLVGGTTDMQQQFVMFRHTDKKEKPSPIKIESQIKQDLRWVLKMGIDGIRTPSPNVNLGDEAYSQVRYYKKGVIISSGLYPVKEPNVQVCTELYNGYWVIRDFTNQEKLMLYDVPERLIRQCNDDALTALIALVHTPLKFLSGIMMAVKAEMEVENKKHGIKEVVTTSKSTSSKWADTIIDWDHLKSHPKWDLNLQKVDEGIDEDMSIAEPAKVAVSALNIKATKSDNAEVPIQLWNTFLFRGLRPGINVIGISEKLDVMRELLLCKWRRNVLKSFLKWESDTPQSHDEWAKSREAARDCIARCCDASWWSWDRGSRPFFWRWPSDYRIHSRDGIPPWYLNEVTTWRRAQRPPKHPDRLPKIQEKLMTVRGKGYVGPGKVSSLMSFFEVPKGDADVRMVYDGTASGLNDSIWAPWFPLPTVDCLIRAVEPGYCMADNDVAEMFHNFMMHESMQKYCGLDLTLYFQDVLKSTGKKRLWERWNRLAMGLTSSPYASVQAMMFAEEMILGNPKDANNVFRWSQVRLNLPGSSAYDPSKAWVSKIREDGVVAADVFTYVDDIRTSAPTIQEAWEASQRTSTVLGYLGIQDAARKRRDPGEETGAWTGSIVWTTNNEVSVMTSQEKWDKTRNHLTWIRDSMANDEGINHKQLQSCRGFLVYVARTYPSFVPYLKGIHATIDSWRPGRDIDGWRFKRNRSKKKGNRKRKKESHIPWEQEQLEVFSKFGIEDESPDLPDFVYPVPRLFKDVEALLSLADSPIPPKRKIRMQKQARVMYGFGDASKRGFGATIELPDHNMYWKCGQWRVGQAGDNSLTERTIVQEQSSNYRELHNLVLALEEASMKGWLAGQEVFMFTDNSTAEAAYFKGTSSSEQLFYLVLRLRKLQMEHDCIIHLVHVAGTRMIWQGTDGLSRGDFTSGVMGGESMISFVPLHLSAYDRSPGLVKWIESWCPTSGSDISNNVEVLTKDDWPRSCYSNKTYVWIPPPAGAEVAAEFLAKAIHKRPNSVHIFLCPRLLTSRWFRLVNKLSDCMFDIPVCSPVWDRSQHEPLMLFLSLPLSRTKPWRHKLTPASCRSREEVQFLFANHFDRAGVVLREFILRAWNMAAM